MYWQSHSQLLPPSLVCILYEVLKNSAIQSDIGALLRMHQCAGTSSLPRFGQISGTISKMALKSAGPSVLHNRFLAGLEYQLEFL